MEKIDSDTDIFVYVMHVPSEVPQSIREYEEKTNKKYRIMLLWDSRIEDINGKMKNPEIDLAIDCDFSDSEAVEKALAPYKENILAITCRSEKYMSRFIDIIPSVPYLKTPTIESLLSASDKYEMRKKMKAYEPTITPKFTLVKENTEEERERVIKKIGFPMIIKPTNLAGSLFVAICYHEEELEKTLKLIIKNIQKAYDNDDRPEVPKIIAEEYMEGDLYSIDSYVDEKGIITHCPMVKQLTAKKIGRDDFYNYLQITPTPLKTATVGRAEMAAENAVMALGIKNATTHTELMKIDDEWKVVEVGARAGGFRPILHKLSCDIDHDMNDLLVRMGKKVVMPKKCKGFACTLKWFAKDEGKITEMKGLKKIEQLESFYSIDVNKKIGDKSVFARYGGRSVFNLFLYNSDHSKLLADIRRVEQLVEIKVSK